MHDILAVTLSVALPWLTGGLGAAAIQRRWSRPDLLLCIGYGYLFGAFTTTLIMRGLDLMGVRWTPILIAIPLAALAGIGYWAARRSRVTPAGPTVASYQETRDSASGLSGRTSIAARTVFWCFFALVAVRLAGLGLEIIWRPLLAWDAWAQWATKARVWFEYRQLAAFISPAQWLHDGGAMQFMDTHSDYPGTVPLLQVWTALCLARWDESLINVPWLAVAVALAFAFYAQLRRLRLSAAIAMMCTYLLLSLPFLDVHIALAGYADIFVAATYGCAAMALWEWIRSRANAAAIFAVVCAVICIATKKEGVLWVLTLLPPLLVAVNRRVGLRVVALLGACALLWVLFGPAQIRLFGYLLRTEFVNVARTVFEHLLLMDNWHLLWYATMLTVAVNYRRLFDAATAPMTVTMLGAFGFVFVVFFFSSAAGGVAEESLVNRLPLHLVPALVFYLVYVWSGRWPRAAAVAAVPPVMSVPDDGSLPATVSASAFS